MGLILVLFVQTAEAQLVVYPELSRVLDTPVIKLTLLNHLQNPIRIDSLSASKEHFAEHRAFSTYVVINPEIGDDFFGRIVSIRQLSSDPRDKWDFSNRAIVNKSLSFGQKTVGYVKLERNYNCKLFCMPDSTTRDTLYIHTDTGRYEVLLPCFVAEWGLYRGPCSVNNEDIENPTKFLLSAYPNPFNPGTIVSFELDAASNLNLSVFDMNGRLVETLFSGLKSAGRHTVSWNASNQSSGIYLLKLEINGKVLTKKMTLIK